ncbi:MAG: V-type ATP synthase subunit I [Nanobdellota archaeon]
MLKPEEMTKIRIYAPKANLNEVVNLLHKEKAVDIIEHQRDDKLDIGSPLEGVEEVSDAVIKARSLIYRLKFGEEKEKTHQKKFNLAQVVKEIKELYEKVNEIYSELKEKKAKEKKLKDVMQTLKNVEELGVPIKLYKETQNLKYYLGYLEDVENFEKQLKTKIGNKYKLYSKKQGNSYLVSAFIDKSNEWDFLQILQKQNFTEVKIPEECQEFGNSPEKIQNNIDSLKQKRKDIEKELSEIKKKHHDLKQKEAYLAREAKIAEAPLKFGETKNISIISGWIPTKAKNRLENNIQKLTKDSCYIEELEASNKENAPIKLKNPAGTKAYEFLLRLFSMPNYKEIDPTIFIFFTFPLFFGFMLGDIGYGITTLILFMLLKLKMPQAKSLLNIMIFCSIVTIIFGCAFGEIYGFEITELLADSHGAEGAASGHAAEKAAHHEPASFGEWLTTWPVHRNADNAINLVILSIIIGAIHVNLGLAFGFFNVLKEHGFKDAIYEKGSWLLLEIAVVMIGLSMAGAPLLGIILGKDFIWIGLGLILVSSIMLYKGEGVQGLVELPSIFVHIASYMRLMAIGLASVSLAIVINEQSGNLFSLGPVGVVAAIIIFTLGHVINIALGIIGPFLHSLRLHYVEHFTKFYKGGGREFSPFGAEDN